MTDAVHAAGVACRTITRATSHRSMVLGAVAIATALVLTPAGVAHADAAAPTNFRSQVTGVQPPVDGVTVQVTGGDAFLRIAVRPGHRVTVYGYGRGGGDEEPYLQVQPDGTVLANINSPAYYLNQDRYAAVDPPASASVQAQPKWAPVGHGGAYAWHDHRIHWMSPTLPPAVRGRAGQVTPVFDWSVPLAVDGQPVTVRGQLTWLPSPSPLPPIAAGLGALAAAAAAVRAFRWPAAVAGLLAAGGLTLTLAAGDALEAGMTGVGMVLSLAPAAAGVLATLAAAVRRRRRVSEAPGLLLLAAAFLLVWILPRLDVLTKPVVPTILPDTVSRLGLAAAVGLALGTAASTLAWGRQRWLSGEQPG